MIGRDAREGRASQAGKVVVYYPRFGAMGGGEVHALQTALALTDEADVWVVGEGIPSPQATMERYGVDTSALHRHDLAEHPGLARRILGPEWALRRWKHPFVTRAHRRVLRALRPDVFISFDSDRPFASAGALGAYFCFFPASSHGLTGQRRAVRAYHELCSVLDRVLVGRSDQNIRSYQSIIANSSYSARWVERLWHIGADYIWPPCTDMGPPAAEKKPWILGVGRFHAPDGMEHSKSQDVMVEAFAKLCAQQGINFEVQLHLVGDLNGEERNDRWLEELRSRAEGLPVVFHPNASFDELRMLYRQSALFWIATGFGFDQESFPGKQEHFGMVTVEAMSAGAVPLARLTGGSPEIIDEHSGLLWADKDELVAQTAALLADTSRRDAMAQAAVDRARRFGVAAYHERVRAAVAALSPTGGLIAADVQATETKNSLDPASLAR